MDYTEKYELDAKAGNRLGRRLRTLGGSIGKRVGKIRNAVEAYDPNAFDGDGDGLIQDGSPWERPVVARSQVLPTAISAEAEIVASDERIPQRDTQYTRARGSQDDRRETLRSSGRDELDLYEDDTVAATATGDSTAPRDRAQELRDKDHRLPGSTADMTPEELAELAVPGTIDEVIEHGAKQAVGHPSQYASQADYEKALETHKAFVRSQMEAQKRFYDEVETAYDARHGTGAFNDDSHRNKAQFRQRMIELVGDHSVHSALVGTPVLDPDGQVTTLPGLEELSQEKFLDDMISNPNIPSWKREIYRTIRNGIRREQSIYLNAVPNDGLVPNGQDTLIFAPPINPLHAFAVYVLAGNSMRKHDGPNRGGDGQLPLIRHDRPELSDVPQDAWNTQGMTGEELLSMAYEDYFAWSALRQDVVNAGIKRGTNVGDLPTNQQIKTRIEMASRAKNIHFAMHMLFPGQTEVKISEIDERTGIPKLTDVHLEARKHSNNPSLLEREHHVQTHAMYTHDKDTVEKMRAILARGLRENPQILDLFRKFGVPAYSILHPLFSPEYQRLPDDAYISAQDVLDRSPSGRQKIFGLMDKLSNLKFLVASQRRNTQKETSGRHKNPFFTRILSGKSGSGSNLGPNGVVGRTIAESELGGDTEILFGSYPIEGTGGWSSGGTGLISLAPEVLDISLMTPIGVSEDIIDTQNLSSITKLGPMATPLHEWVHWAHEHFKQDAIRILRRRADKMEQDLISGGMSPREARKESRIWLKKTSYEHGLFPQSDPNVGFDRAQRSGNVVDWANWWNLVRKSEFGDELFDRSDPDDPRSSVPLQRPVHDFDAFADYGYSSREEMEDDFLIAMRRIFKDGFQRGGLLSEVSDAGLQANPLQSDEDLKLRRRRAATRALTSNEGYVRTPYGQSKWQERITEASVGTFMRIFRDKPFMVNDAMIDILSTLFMRRDKDGPLTEKHGILGIRRRKKRRDGTFSRQFEEDLVPPTSTKRIILPSEKRGPDGHKESLRSAGRVSAVDSRSMRFDPDERSRLRSGASNIGLDTDERLYAFDEPISVSDFRARARTLSIGDHHFYDSGVPYSQSLGSRRRAILGLIAGRAYVNRTRPHEGDMVRAMSATQFGMFVDDMPTYETTTENDRAMLRGLVSGRIVDLPMSSRARIETALKNATHIHSAVQSQTPNKHELYRVVNAEPRSFVEGLVVGERIPMPITAFARTRPRADAGETVIRIQRGAKAIDVEDGQFLTQGTFEVVALDMVDGQITATLKHVETYDPRHDAMRPVDRFSDKPGAMRKFGSPRPRYTQQEQQRMEVDLARRTDKAEMDERMYGLRSSGASGLGEDIDKELDLLVGVQELREPASQGIIKQLRAKIRGTLQAQVDRRLDKAREAMQELYGGFKPWRDDAEIINRYAASDPEYRQEVLSNIFERMKARVIETAEMGGNTDAVQWVPNSTAAERKAIAEKFFQTGGDLTVRQLDALIESGQLEFHMETRSGRLRIGNMVRGDLAGRAAVTLTSEEREVLSVIRDFLKVGSRAYMIDVDNPKEFNSAGRTLTVIGDTFRGEPRFKFRLSSPDAYADSGFGSDAKYHEFWFSGEVRRDDVMAGNFNRVVSVNDGLITVEHSSMNMMGAGGGAATILNQHSWQWWKQLPGTRVLLTAADDGPIVWPRHGFHPNRSRFEYGEETGVNFDKLVQAVSYIIGATSSDQQARMNAYRNRGENFENLAQVRVDSDGRRKAQRASSQLRDEILGMTGFKGPEEELSENDKRLRERLGLWLALAIKDRARVSNDEPRQATLVLLANLLDVGDMDDTQLDAWKNLFADVYYGQYKIELDGFDNDPDFLPSFIVNDEDPTAAIVARRIAIAEERAQNASTDLFAPNPNNENANPETITAITARVSRVGSLYANSRAANDSEIINEPSNEAVLAREMSGGEELPRLISKTDAEAALSQAINGSPNVNPIRPWLSARDPERGRTRVVLVGISQDSRRLTDIPSLIEVAGNFLRQNRTRQWDEIDNRFRLDPIFTSTPGEFVERFVDPNDPTVDPADNKVGLLGITDQNARWITRDEIGAVTNTVRGAIQQMYDDSDAQLSPIFSRWEKIQFLRDIKVNGKNLYKKEWWLSGYIYTLDPQVLDEFLDKYYPDADKLVIRSIFGSFGDHITMHGSANITEMNKIEAQATWLYNLFTTDTSDSKDSRARQTLASMLGYDFLDETPDGSTRSTVHVLNRGALTMVDEPVSLSEINGITGITATPRVSRSLRSSGISTTMMLGEDGAPTLLELNDPLSVTATGMRSLSYSRSLRQDYGINSPRSLRSSGNKAYELMMKREREWFAGRNDRRQEIGDINSSITPKMYAADINARMEKYTRITEGIEEIDDELSELDNRLTDLTDAGELTPELDKEIDDQYWSLEAQKAQLEMDKKDVADSIASDINTLNEMMDAHEQREGLAFAIRKFLSEQVSLDIPEAYREKLQALLTDLDAQAARAPSTKDIKARHKILSNLLDDDSEFDIRWDITRDDDDIEGVDLEDFDDDFEWAGEKWLEWIYRSFFDPSYAEWSRAQRTIQIWDTVFSGRLIPNELSAEMRASLDKERQRRSTRDVLGDLINDVVRGVTAEERSLWSRQHDEMLRNEYNADYEEAVIDATPADSSAVPRNVPERTWKKILASARLARRTPYEGERDAALRTAKRLIEPHRPDLADDDYLMSLRSSGGGAPYPMISGVNFNRMGLRSRGAAPEVVTVPKPDRFHSRLIERLSKYDIKEKDLMVDGKYGKVLALLMSPQDPLSIDQLENIIDNPDKPIGIGFGERMPLNEMLPEPISDQDKEVLKEIIRESAKIAAQSGWGITAIEGHRVKKINGAHHEELTDVLVDEVDLAMIRAMGSPTYERIARIHGVWARTVNRLNKMFGAYESREDDGAVVRVGSDLEGDNGSYRSFLDGGDAKIEGDVVNYYDTRGNLVMSVNRELGAEKSGRITTPKSLVLNLGRNTNTDQRWRFESTTANDAIMEAMFLAAGVNDFSIRRENEFAEEPQFVPASGRSLTKLRARLARAKEQAEMMSFAPTPAGRHMEDMVLQEVKRLESHIDMYERLGQRFVRLIQESEGISKDEVGERLKQLANTLTRGDDAFSNGSPASELSMLSMYEIALSAFMSMRLGSRNMPRISDEEALINGTHEIGHFVFGQAFTRHGEFMSNFWPYATMGPEFWTNFIQNQLPQSEIFDRFTLEEGLGLRWTREQRELFDSLSEETRDLLIETGIVDITGNPRSGRAEARRSDVEKFRNDIIRNVEEDPTIDDIEKAEIITGLRQIELSRETSFSSSRREQFEAALDGDLTPEVLRTLRIDPLSEDDPHVARWSTSTPWDQFVRIEPSDIGWQRTSASGSSLRSSGAPTNRVNRPYRGDDEQLIKLAEEGLTIREIAERIGINYRNAAVKIQRLRKAGKIGKIKRPLRDDSLTVNRRVAIKTRTDAYINYHQNLLRGMSRAEALEVFLDEIRDEDFRVVSERGARETRKLRLEQLLKLLEIVNEGLPREAIANREGPKRNNNDYILINEMKLLGFSHRETQQILRLSPKTVNAYRQIHHRAYRKSKEQQTLRSSGASPDVRARVRDSVQAVAAVDGDVYDPLYELLVNEKKANFSNQQRERVFRVLAEEIEDLDKYDITIPMDDEGLEELAATLFRRALGRRASQVVLTNNLRQGLAEFIRLRTADERARRSRREEVASFPSAGAPSLRSSGENISTFGQMLRDQELAEASRLATAPSRGETPISAEKRRELVSIGERSRMTEERLDSLIITEKAEREFTVAEYEEVTRLLDDSDKKLDKAIEMLEDKRMRLQDEQWHLQNLYDTKKITDRQNIRLIDVEEMLEELERQEEILNRGYEANRLARLMIRALRANSNNPRRDEYDNKYIIIRNADGTLAGMTMWGFLGVDVTFNTPKVPYAVDATALPPEDRITGRMVFVDYLMSFQNVPGMGSYLFRRVLEDARGRNARKVFLEVTDSSRPYWEQVGFAERRIAGSTSQYHEYVARVDEMLEAIESSSEETN